MSAPKKQPLTRLLTAYETAAVEPQDDGSVLIHVESKHEDLLLATFAIPAEALVRFDLRQFPDARTDQRERMRLYMKRKRASNPAFRERERDANRQRMARVRRGKGRPKAE
ncbi:MAG TPA: hypothetical protein VHA70_10075 [Bauldia sp.]|nr:hypothetical protein [Bauldia sp.]